MPPEIVAVHQSPRHSFSKESVATLTLISGLGVQGDAHCGVTVKHRSRVAKDPFAPNLRQVHLLHAELFDELLARHGFEVRPGALGENITTRGIDLLGLPADTELRFGADAVIRLTGLRNPCLQIDKFKRGLMAAVLDKTADGQLIRKSGVMGIVLIGGLVQPGQAVSIQLPAGPHRPLQPV